MNITVSGQYDVPDLPSGTQVVLALSPTEMAEANVDLLRPDYFWLPMDDVEGDEDGDFAPSELHLKRLTRLLYRTEATHLHIACQMGVSRSTALLAHTLAVLHPAMSDRAIADEVLLIRPGASPNRLVLELSDERLERNLAAAFNTLAAYD